VTVWYKACPEVKGINPQVMVIWPAKLSYEPTWRKPSDAEP
jgi:hypothetical protein